MSEKIIGKCPHCGREVEIPAELEEFSCLYCGARSRTELLAAQGSFDESSMLTLARKLPRTVDERAALAKSINKKDYVPSFEGFEAAHKPLLTELDLAVCTAPSGIETATTKVCAEFLDALEQELQSDKRYQSKLSRSNALFDLKLVLALYLTPLVRKLHLRMAESFCEELNKQWLQRYPKEMWIPGEYEKIAGGFRKRKLCFITTATCLHEGKPDDCAELTALRAFRDGWMRQNGDEALIAEYYEIAPTLVTLMEHCDNAETCYAEIRSRWLAPCLRDLEQGRNEACRRHYIEMVQTLKNRYLQ